MRVRQVVGEAEGDKDRSLTPSLSLTQHPQLHATQHSPPVPNDKRLRLAAATILPQGGGKHVAVLVEDAVVKEDLRHVQEVYVRVLCAA